MVVYAQHYGASQPDVPEAVAPQTEMQQTYDPKLQPQHTGTTLGSPAPQYASVPQYAPAAPPGNPQYAAAAAPHGIPQYATASPAGAQYGGVMPVYSPPPAQQPFYPPPAQEPNFPPPGHSTAPVEAPGAEHQLPIEAPAPQSPPANHSLPAQQQPAEVHEAPSGEAHKAMETSELPASAEAPVSDATTTTSPAVHH
jgi:hypothetical protein